MSEPRSDSPLARLFRPIAEVRGGEALTALGMFVYSFLAMTAHNVVKPITRSEFIASLGADNLPWVQFAAGVLIGFIMQGYTWLMGFVPRRFIVPVTQAGLAGLLVVFWVLFTTMGAQWVAVAFYLLGLIMGILLISQFWTIANDVYDARQAKRLFGLIGGGASLGGATGAAITGALVGTLGSHAMLLVSAVVLAACALLVAGILRREKAAGTSDASTAGEEKGVGAAEAFRLLRASPHLQIIALIIGFVAIGAAIVEQQLNMAAAEAGGSKDAVAALLAQVIVYLSLIGFLIQVLVTSRVHRVLGIGIALLILPVSLGSTGVLMLVSGAFWSAGLARIVDSSLRYTIDKTSREVLFLPLPLDLKYRAKPFIDVSVDRFAKGLGALLILVLIKDWGLGFDWRELSYASLTIMTVWVLFALRARREYLRSFRARLVEGLPSPAEGKAQPLAEGPVDAALVERQIAEEASRAFAAFAAHYTFAARTPDAGDVPRAHLEERDRAVERVFQLLSRVHPPGDIAAVRATLALEDAHARSSAIEYLDNLLSRGIRRRVLVLVEDLPDEERFEKGRALFGSAPAAPGPDAVSESRAAQPQGIGDHGNRAE